MSTLSNVIAWLVPTARGSYADKTTSLSSNAHLTVPSDSNPLLVSSLPNLISSKPENALQLSFDHTPKNPGSFVVGTDPTYCDIILPQLEGISPRHCAFGFDSQYRLVLDDFSGRGTQVWYDWESCGDKTDYTWILSNGTETTGFPSTIQHITVDIQSVRFYLIVNNHSENLDAYKQNVDDFFQQESDSSWLMEGLKTTPLAMEWDYASSPIAPIMPLFSSTPLFQHIYVKSFEDDQNLMPELYLWNLAKPWEPMIKAGA